MNNLVIPGTSSTPTIHAQWAEGVLSMKGDSYPENSLEMFQPVLDWVTDFLAQSPPALTLELELLYLNTSSIRALMDILDMLEDAHQNGIKIAAVWHYDAANERVMELAEEFKEDCTFPFNIQQKA